MRKIIAVVSAALAFLLVLPVPGALAEGTETLGPPAVTIATGTGIATGGTGLEAQPGTINLNVPPAATVKQVLLYWEGHHTESTAPDNTIVVNGTGVTGTLIGGPTHFFSNGTERIDSTSFRADITSLGAVGPGASNVSLSGLTFNYSNDGAGIVAIFDDGSAPASILVRDGNDLAFELFAGDTGVTVPQTFTFPVSNFARSAALNLQVGSVESANRPNKINITVGNTVTTLVNPLSSGQGQQWDSLDIPVNIPAGVTTVTVQIISESNDPNKLGASLAWVSATLAVRGGQSCPSPSATPAITHGSAYALDATLLNLHPINQVGKVATVAPGAPANQAKQLASPNIPGLVSAGLLITQSNSSLSPSTSTASSTVADVSLLGGLVTATTVRGVSQSVASTGGSSYNSNGSVIQGLTVNNTAVAVVPNTKVAVKSLGVTIAELYIYEESGTSTFANAVSSSSHSVNMLRLVLLKPFLTAPAGTQVVVSHAQTDAQSPTVNCPGFKSVSGEAFTAFVNGDLAGQHLVDVKVGDAVLPSTGGSNSDGTSVNQPGIATSSTAANTTSGSLQPSPNATSRSVVEGARVLGTAVTADVLDVKSTSSANGATAATTFNVTFVNLKVGGLTVNSNVAPNTQIILNLGGGSFVSVLLNEQVVNGNGTTDTAGTVNAVHARVFAAGGLLQGEVIVASAHSDAHA